MIDAENVEDVSDFRIRVRLEDDLGVAKIRPASSETTLDGSGRRHNASTKPDHGLRRGRSVSSRSRERHVPPVLVENGLDTRGDCVVIDHCRKLRTRTRTGRRFNYSVRLVLGFLLDPFSNP